MISARSDFVFRIVSMQRTAGRQSEDGGHSSKLVDIITTPLYAAALPSPSAGMGPKAHGSIASRVWRPRRAAARMQGAGRRIHQRSGHPTRKRWVYAAVYSVLYETFYGQSFSAHHAWLRVHVTPHREYRPQRASAGGVTPGCSACFLVHVPAASHTRGCTGWQCRWVRQQHWQHCHDAWCCTSPTAVTMVTVPI